MARQSYEYIVVDIDPDADDLEEQMNEYGMQQWELCGILSNDALIFKRASDGIKKFTGSGTRRKRPERKSITTTATV